MKVVVRTGKRASRHLMRSSRSFRGVRSKLYVFSRMRMSTISAYGRKDLFSARARRGFGFYVSKRYATSPMPYRPGYGLGSIIEPHVISGMEIEAKTRNKIIQLQQIENDFESTAKDLKNERDRLSLEAQMENKTIDVVKYDNKIAELMQQREPVQQQRFDAYNELFSVMTDLMASGQSASTFNEGVLSPIDWTACDVVYRDRAYDSISVNASFHAREGNKQSSGDFASGVASSAALNFKGKGKGLKGEVDAAVKDSVQAYGDDKKDEQFHQSVLVLTAFATHRKVQQFDNVIIDSRKLIKAYNHYFPDDRIEETSISESDFKPKDANNKISILGECFLGSAMIGMVHFLRSKEASSSQRSYARERDLAARVEFMSRLSSITGAAQLSTSAAKKMASVLSQDEIDVKFDLVCLGYLPRLHSNNLEMTISKFNEYDPATFTKESATVIGGTIEDSDASRAVKDNKELSQRQSNMSSVINATVLSVAEADSMYKANVLDMDTFMAAFDDYTENAPSSDGMGIPVGMNVISFNRGDVCLEYAKQWLGINDFRDDQ